MKLTLQLTGIRPMLMHNARLANPIDPYTRRVKELTSKRKKTDEDLILLMQAEARGSAYETTDNLLGLPTVNVWRCLYDAAKAFKRGEDIKRAVSHDPVVEPLLIPGKRSGSWVEVDVDKYLADGTKIDYRSVKVTTSRVMRSRPVIMEWRSTHTFEVLDDIIDARDLPQIIERAGRVGGMCDYRPIYGTFTTEIL